MEIDFSLIIPVYKNEKEIDNLFNGINYIQENIKCNFEVIFIVDGSPDASFEEIRKNINFIKFSSQIILLSKNFGSFAAMRTGLEFGRGKYFGIMAADLQEPPDLILEFYRVLESKKFDVVIGVRNKRQDPFFSKIASNIFWRLYRHFIFKEMPSGGVDIFGCNKYFREQVLALKETRSSLIAQIFWVGFEKGYIKYDRMERKIGRSSWTFNKKIDYMLDSIFSFTDLPIFFLIRLGIIGTLLTSLAGIFVIYSKIFNFIEVAGYVPIMLAILFCCSINLIGFGIVGIYAWRAYENSKNRPLSIVAKRIIDGHI